MDGCFPTALGRQSTSSNILGPRIVIVFLKFLHCYICFYLKRILNAVVFPLQQGNLDVSGNEPGVRVHAAQTATTAQARLRIDNIRGASDADRPRTRMAGFKRSRIGITVRKTRTPNIRHCRNLVRTRTSCSNVLIGLTARTIAFTYRVWKNKRIYLA